MILFEMSSLQLKSTNLQQKYIQVNFRFGFFGFAVISGSAAVNSIQFTQTNF
jgi:hypothetical protein